MKQLLVLLLLLSMSFATIQLVTPKHISIESLQEVEISPVGPGHEVFLKFQRKVGDYVWDNVKLVNVVDPDWQTNTFNDYEYVYYSLRVPASKASGMYTFQFEIRDEQGLKDSEIAVVQVVVTHNQDELIQVFPMPKKVEGYAAEEFNVSFNLQNKALSRVNYTVTSSIKELPSLGETTLTHSFLSDQKNKVHVPVLLPEEGEYTLIAHVWDANNPTIDQTVESKLVVKPTFRSKLKSIGNGFPLVPLTMAPFYSVLGMFGW